ncbi:hypothetical protein [Micromonospora zhanjiangensis]|uniref:Peptidase MA superfamily n=1 Tax=Micromonospora zhanjiangensis TaxID=1522057 RepID=A0ABV8KTC9_9ACTN
MIPDRWRRLGRTRGEGAGRRRRWWVWAGTGLVSALLAAVGVLVVSYPAMAASACPGCYGFERVEDRVYAGGGLSDDRRRAIGTIMTAADHRIGDFYGSRLSRPTVLICTTDECYQRIGGGREKGRAFLNRTLMLSPEGINVVIATHELAHVEFHERLNSGGVPQWFDEGLAVLVSDDPRYLGPDGPADRCLVDQPGTLPATLAEWMRADGGDQLYARAACRVSRWAAAHGGAEAVRDLLRRLNAGESFTAVVPG